MSGANAVRNLTYARFILTSLLVPIHASSAQAVEMGQLRFGRVNLREV